MRRYEAQREVRIPVDHSGPRPTGGIAGSRWGVKCLHAQFADTAAGNQNPIGSDVAIAVEPLDCVTPCVHAPDGVPVRDPEWREPS